MSDTARLSTASQQATPGTPNPTAPHKTLWRSVKENLEAIIVAVVLALIIRHFSLEAFEIPTGSMAPGLNGVHVDSECPNCGTTESIGINTDQVSGVVNERFSPGFICEGKCPTCGVEIEAATMTSQDAVFCKSCSKHVELSPESFRRSNARCEISAWCRECLYEYNEVFEPRDCLGGHKILVNKFVYNLRSPRRWEVIVFKFNRQRNYIKRLIGLPGEQVQVIDGDIWINGRIERKPAWAQRALWFPVHDSRRQELGAVKPPAFERTGEKIWQGGAQDFTFNALPADGGLIGSQGGLRYQREIRNRYAYNSARGADNYKSSDSLVKDLRILADLTVNGVVNGAQGSVRFDIHNGDRIYRCLLPASRGAPVVAGFYTAKLKADGAGHGPFELLKSFETVALSRKQTQSIDYFLADRQLVLSIDGTEIAAFPLDQEDLVEPGGVNATVSIQFENLGGVFDRIQIFRDIHYTTMLNGPYAPYATTAPYVIPDGEYFAMGDNSPASMDSRYWKSVSGENMLGRAFAIFWPALPWRFELGLIR